MDDVERTCRPLLEAIAFAARAHRNQTRKDGKTPYHSHVFRVCLIVRHVFEVADPTVLTAAVLHDTIEDTTTDFDDVAEHFGAEVAGWVATLSKDKRLPDDRREPEYMAGLAAAAWQVKVCKLADIFDNLTDSGSTGARQQKRTCHRSRQYLQALDSPALPSPVRRAWDIVNRLLSEVEKIANATAS